MKNGGRIQTDCTKEEIRFHGISSKGIRSKGIRSKGIKYEEIKYEEIKPEIFSVSEVSDLELSVSESSISESSISESFVSEIPDSERKRIKFIFFLYIIWVVKVIIFKYPIASLWDRVTSWNCRMIREGLEQANFTLFKTIRMYIRYSDQLNSMENLAGNIVVFLPLGVLLPCLQAPCKKLLQMLLNVLVFVMGIEIFQLLSTFGVFDVDDILLNTIGAVLGWSLYRWWEYGIQR